MHTETADPRYHWCDLAGDVIWRKSVDVQIALQNEPFVALAAAKSWAMPQVRLRPDGERVGTMFGVRQEGVSDEEGGD